MTERQPALVRQRHIDRQAERHRLLGDPARLMIMEAVTDGPRLISELTALTGLHRNTLRAHLARLIDAGLLTTERRQPIGPGRPATRYLLRDSLGIPGTEQRLLIRSLLRMVSGAYSQDAPGRAETEGRRLGRQLGLALDPPSIEQALRQVVGMLRDLAFAPELTAAEGVNLIALHHCPFAVKADDPRGGIICAFHLGLIRGVVDVAGPRGQHLVRLLPHVEPDLCRAEIRFAAS
jgi:predicted ArsR family transcriptional regulator